MFNLFKILQKRETDNNKKEFKTWINNKVKENLSQNKYSRKNISLKSNATKLKHCGNLVAIFDKDKQLSLFDVSIPVKLWSALVTDLKSYGYDGLNISNSGLVNLII